MVGRDCYRNHSVNTTSVKDNGSANAKTTNLCTGQSQNQLCKLNTKTQYMMFMLGNNYAFDANVSIGNITHELKMN